MKERDFINWIIACAEATGWKVYHVPAPMVAARKGGFVGSRRAAGLPDLFLLHEEPHRMILAEVKGSTGRLSSQQQQFLRLARNVKEEYSERENMLTSAYQEPLLGVYAWTPDQQDLIERILKTKVLL